MNVIFGEYKMEDRISIEGRDGRFNAYIARLKTLRPQLSLFCKSYSGSTPTSAKPVPNWLKKAL